MTATLTAPAAPRAGGPLEADELRRMNAYWRAANYLSVGQIYLLDNPLLREPLKREHIKPRLLGHWGTTPGLNFIYVHLNRRHQEVRPERDLRRRARPRRAGHGRQHLSGRHLQRGLPEHLAGRRRACSGCSSSSPFPAASPATPRRKRPARSTKAANWATRCPTPTARRSTTPICSSAASSATARPRPGRWRQAGTPTSSSIPATDGAVLPILHLNGYKIANPTVLARIPHEELESLLASATATSPISSRATTPTLMHQPMAATLDTVIGEIQSHPATSAREDGVDRAPALADDRPALAQRLDRAERGGRQEDRRLLALAPGADRGHETSRSISPLLEEWMQSYKPEELFDENGQLHPRTGGTGARRASGAWARTRTPTAGCCCETCTCPTSATTPSPSTKPGTTIGGGDARAGRLPARRDEAERGAAQLPRVGARREQLQPAGRRPGRRPTAPGTPRRCPTTTSSVARRAGDGDPERAHLPGLAGRLSADRAARLLLVLRGVHPHRRLDVQPARQVAGSVPPHPLAAAHRLAELPADLARLAAGPQRLLAPGPRLHRPRDEQEGRASSASTCRPTPTACCPWPTTACAAATTSTSSWPASSPRCSTWTWTPPSSTARRASASGSGPATTRAASRTWSWPAPATCRRWRRWPPWTCCGSTVPDLKIRVVNVVDLMTLAAAHRASARPERQGLRHASSPRTSRSSSPTTAIPWLIHRLTYRRTNHDNIHVRGYKEEGTTTTPFDMVVMNDLDRFHLAGDVIDRVPVAGLPGRLPQAAPARQAAGAPSLHPRARRGPARSPRLDLDA